MGWSLVAPLNVARDGLAIANAPAPVPASGLRIYAIGGEENGNMVGQVEVYDPALDTWTTIAAPLPQPRSNLAAAAALGIVHVVGGYDGNAVVGDHEAYDPATGNWTAGPSLLTARSGLAAATGPDGRIYAIGGVDGNQTYLGTVEIFDPAAGSWSSGPSMPTPRSRLAVCSVGGLIYAIGGEDVAGTTATVEVLDPVAGTWGTLVSLPVSAMALAASAGPDGLIYAIGGVDDNGVPTTAVYGLDPSSITPAWSAQAPLQSGQGFLAGGLGPDGRLYAVGGTNDVDEAVGTVEVFEAAGVLPDPYIGNGTYQSPDILIYDSSGAAIPLGGAPGGAWDTLLLPNTNYTIKALVQNDSTTAATWTAVRFWHFPGGVGSAGSLIDLQFATVPAGGSVVVASANPFHSAPSGQHECVAVSVTNAESPYFNVEPTQASEVLDPTVPQPAGSGHYGSAWRNTNSLVLRPGGRWRLGFALDGRLAEVYEAEVEVVTSRVPDDWQRGDKAAELGLALAFTGAQPQVPLFLVPSVRAVFHEANELDVEIAAHDEDGRVRLASGERHRLRVDPGRPSGFTVSGRVPDAARPGEIYLVDVGAHYPAGRGHAASTVRFLEVIYIKEDTP
jgi:hypothetical protein